MLAKIAAPARPDRRTPRLAGLHAASGAPYEHPRPDPRSASDVPTASSSARIEIGEHGVEFGQVDGIDVLGWGAQAGRGEDTAAAEDLLLGEEEGVHRSAGKDEQRQVAVEARPRRRDPISPELLPDVDEELRQCGAGDGPNGTTSEL